MLLQKVASNYFLSGRSQIVQSTKSVCLFTTKALSADERSTALAKLNESDNPLSSWKTTNDGRDAIQKIFEFSDFSQAWSFMSKTSVIAEEMDHHPEWFNVYNRVEVVLTTHDANGLSQKDITMAEKMNKFAKDVLPTRS